MPGRYGPLKPIEWPQDTLRALPGFGDLGPIDAVNKQNVRREFFCLAGTITDNAYGETSSLVFNAPRDGDFWVTSILSRAFDTLTGARITTGVTRFVSILDVMNGYQLYTPFIEYQQLTASGPNSSSRALARTPFIQPYQLMRKGAFRLTLTSEPKAVARTGINFYFGIIGWKEYADASN